jgi:predicted alpha/beta-fold hydrolase
MLFILSTEFDILISRREYFMENFNPVTQDIPSDPQNPASMAPVIFESDGSKILGTMFIASGAELHPVIVLLHGFPGNEVNYDLAHAFKRQGFNVLVFHYRGCWGSEGNYSCRI